MNNTPLRPTYLHREERKSSPKGGGSAVDVVVCDCIYGRTSRRAEAHASSRNLLVVDRPAGGATHASRNLLAVCVCSRSRRRDRPVSVFVSYKYIYILVYSFICYLSAAAYVLQPVVTWFCICVLLMTEIDMQVRL